MESDCGGVLVFSLRNVAENVFLCNDPQQTSEGEGEGEERCFVF